MIALGEAGKSLKQHYARIWDYAGEITRSNSGSSVSIEVERAVPNEPGYFQRMYVCFNGIKKGWLVGCRLVIGLDGCFLKLYVNGESLSAVGRDGNNQMFSIAWVVVEVECRDSWQWFLQCLIDDIGIIGQKKGLGWTVIIDQLKKAAKSGTPQEFDEVVDDLKATNEQAHVYLLKQNPKQWSKAFFSGSSCCDAVGNNMSECFNGCIVDARKKPLIYIIRIACMQSLQKKKTYMEKWDDSICPNVRKKLEQNKLQHRFWKTTYNGDTKFEVRMGIDGYIVDTKSNTCSCRLWEVSGILCTHAISDIYYLKDDPDKYVAHWFRKDIYLKAYEHMMQPLNGERLWLKTSYEKFLPLVSRRMPGRPKKTRRMEVNEEST